MYQRSDDGSMVTKGVERNPFFKMQEKSFFLSSTTSTLSSLFASFLCMEILFPSQKRKQKMWIAKEEEEEVAKEEMIAADRLRLASVEVLERRHHYHLYHLEEV